MSQLDLALLEFDPEREAVFEAAATQGPVDAPLAAVGCFLPDVISAVAGDGPELMRLPSLSPLRETSWNGSRLAVFYPGQGGPLAAASFERVIAAGCRAFVFCGGAGALVPELALGHVVIATDAVRDEGTSFHYAPPSREIKADGAVVSALASICESRGAPYTLGKTWTTDGLFRETRGRIARRREDGCIVADCEASALLAVGQFRGVAVGILLYAADDASGEAWDERGWKKASSQRRRLFDLAAEAAVGLSRRYDRVRSSRSGRG